MPRVVRAFVLFLFVLCEPVWAVDGPKFPDLVAQVEALFEPARDWADVKFRADGISDPSQDNLPARMEMDRLKSELKAFILRMQPRNAHERLHLLKKFIYDAGPWNNHRPYSYDLADPLGKDRVHRYLANYLEGRKGNCITMPILFAILGRSIGLNMTLATAPHHLYVIFTDDQGKAWNFETTIDAGYTRASYIRSTMPMSDRAVQNGVYMRSLSDVEVVSIMASVVVEGLMQRQAFEEAIAVSDALLARDPNSVHLMLARGSSFAGILRRDILSKYTKVGELSRDQLVRAEFLSDHNKLAFDTVEALGWSEQDGEQDKRPPYVKKDGEE